jgi:hypothetical protein
VDAGGFCNDTGVQFGTVDAGSGTATATATATASRVSGAV